MNPNNYATWEASKKLVDAGIVLETDAGWYKIFRPGCHSFDMVLSLRSGNEKFYGDNYPAPSMAEVWRELPATVPEKGLYAPLKLRKAGDGKTWGSYFRNGSQIIDSIKANINPTDALIDLLIWVKEEASHG